MISGGLNTAKINRAHVKDLARQRIARMFKFAMEAVKTDPALANRYVEIALRISMRTRVRIPRDLKRMVCRDCGALLLPGITSRVRVRQGRQPHVSVTCLSCGRVKRYQLRRRA